MVGVGEWIEFGKMYKFVIIMNDEKIVESYLRNEVQKRGAECIKIECNFMIGMPDRICTLPNGKVVWVEVKAKGEKPRKIQLFCHEKLRKAGQAVEVVDSKEQVDDLIARYYVR